MGRPLEKPGTFLIKSPGIDLEPIPQKYWVFGDKNEGGIYRPRGYNNETDRIIYAYHPLGLHKAFRATGYINRGSYERINEQIDQATQASDQKQLAELDKKRGYILKKTDFVALILASANNHYRAELTSALDKFRGFWEEGQLKPGLTSREAQRVAENLLDQVRVNPYKQTVIRLYDVMRSRPTETNQDAAFARWVNSGQMDQAGVILSQAQDQIAAILAEHQNLQQCCRNDQVRAA